MRKSFTNPIYEILVSDQTPEQERGLSILQINPPPVLRRPWTPGRGAQAIRDLVDILANGGVGLVAVIDDQIEAERLVFANETPISRKGIAA
jgi:hypothetical protein